MSAATTAPLPPPPPPPVREPLRRLADDRVVGGVAGGIARWLDVDPVLVRVAFVVLAIFGGSGLVLYVIGWLFVPAEGDDSSAASSLLGGNRVILWLAAVVVAVLALSLVGDAWAGNHQLPQAGPPWLLVILAVSLGLVYWRRSRPAEVTRQSPAAASNAQSVNYEAAAPAKTRKTRKPPKPPRPPRERSVLGRATCSVMLLVLGVLIATRLSGATSVSAVTMISAALAVVGAGLLVGTARGRSRGLIWLGVLLILLLVPVAAIDKSGYAFANNGTITYQPTQLRRLKPSYELGAGQLTLDLTRLQTDRQTQSSIVRLGVGNILIVVPRSLAVKVTASAQRGAILVPRRSSVSGTNVSQTYVQNPARIDAGQLQIDAEVGIGYITVETR